jgi:aryl-alcohol dehydrogenase-like predicted oxidoreductase
MSSRIALGTAQFGAAYGIANASGQVSLQSAREILDVARAADVDTLDTAALYGASEATLGQIGVADFLVVTKLPGLPDDCGNVDAWVRAATTASLRRLNVASLAGLLLHRPADLLGANGEALFAALLALKSEGLVAKIGYSVYSPDEFDALVKSYSPDLVQAPYNVFDRRLEASGWLSRLRDIGAEVHTRSAFLQGLLLFPRGGWPKKFQPWRGLLEIWHDWCEMRGLTPVQAALAHALGLPGVDRVVVGVDSAPQLQKIVQASGGSGVDVPVDIRSSDDALINPSRWNAL